MTSIEIFHAGDDVPRSWFSKLGNVEQVKFEHPCIVETEAWRRTIRKVTPALSGPMLYFKHYPDSDGYMTVEFDRPTELVMNW
jgi:hypothetical protein